jgi:uncharacterized protein
MYRFEELEDVLATIEKLSQREPALVAVLPRQPGTKESRYMHLLSGDASVGEVVPRSTASSGADRVSLLEGEVAELRKEVASMREEWAAFRKQFE